MQDGRKTKRLGQSPVQRSGLVCRAVSGSSGLWGDQPVSLCHQFGNEQVCDAVVVGFFSLFLVRVKQCVCKMSPYINYRLVLFVVRVVNGSRDVDRRQQHRCYILFYYLGGSFSRLQNNVALWEAGENPHLQGKCTCTPRKSPSLLTDVGHVDVFGGVVTVDSWWQLARIEWNQTRFLAVASADGKKKVSGVENKSCRSGVKPVWSFTYTHILFTTGLKFGLVQKVISDDVLVQVFLSRRP